MITLSEHPSDKCQSSQKSKPKSVGIRPGRLSSGRDCGRRGFALQAWRVHNEIRLPQTIQQFGLVASADRGEGLWGSNHAGESEKFVCSHWHRFISDG